MKLHLIASKQENNLTLNSLKKAAEERDVIINVINSKKSDFFSLPTLEKGDMLFRQSTTSKCRQIERHIIRDDTAHFGSDVDRIMGKRTSSYFYNKKAGLPVVQTIPIFPSVASDIPKHVEHLGGFPIIVKVMGSSNGVGVMRADSLESLKSILDYVRDLSSMVLLRKFVPHSYYGRLIVVGDKVIASHRAFNMPDEFRTNAHGNIDENKEGITFSEEIQETAVKAVHSLGVDFGGVDLLFKTDTEYYISEVNSPCDYRWTEEYAGADISGPMLDYLIKKSELLTSK